MFDNRFPFLVRIERARLPEPNRSKMIAFARAASNRSFLSVCYNTKTGGLHFYIGEEPDRGVYEYPWGKMMADRQPATEADLDSLVSYLGQRNISRRAKDRIAAANEKSKQHDLEERRGRLAESVTDDVWDYAGFNMRRRRGVQTVVSMPTV